MKWVICHNVSTVSQKDRVIRVSLAGHTFPRAGRPDAKLLSLLHVEIATMPNRLLTKSMVFMTEEPTASRIGYQLLRPSRDDRT